MLKGVRSTIVAACLLGVAMPGASQVTAAPGTNTAPPTLPVPPLADFFQPATAEPKVPDPDGFLQRWLILEPTSKPNRTNQDFVGSYVRRELAPATFPGKFNAVPRDGQVARGAVPLRWHALDARGWSVDLFNFAQSLNKPKYGVIFWAVTVIESPREMRNVRLAVGSNSASRWWLNGQEAVALFDDRRMVIDDVVSAPLTLRRGRNVLVGAVINGPGLSAFAMRFLDEGGAPIRDIQQDVK
jgi:hypothetical protein